MANYNPVKELADNLFWSFLCQGLFFIILGLLIWVYPQTLVYLVVTLFVLVGLAAIVTGTRIKRLGKDISEL